MEWVKLVILSGLVFVFGSIIFVMIQETWSTLQTEFPTDECSISLHKLKAVQFYFDSDTGLVSGGSTKYNMLYFEDGLIVKDRFSRVDSYQIGDYYTIKSCWNRNKSNRIISVE